MKSYLQNKTTRIILCLIAVLYVASICVYPNAPDEIATHWGMDNQVNGTSPKIFLLLFPLFVLGLDLSLIIFRRIDPKKDNYNKFSSSYDTIRLMLALILSMTQLVTIVETLHPGTINIGMSITLLVGMLFIVMGNQMPRFRQNYFAGIKTPWTLADEEVWQKTHRVGGRIWFLGGFVICIASFFDGSINAMITMSTVAIMTIVPLAYSYAYYRKKHKKGASL